MHFNGLNRWISTILTIIIVIAILFSVSAASGTLYVNGSGGILAGLLKDSYAIGSGGTGVLGSNSAYVLTGDGMQTITDTGTTPSGDGFAPISGTVSVKYDRVKIGLYYKTGSYNTAVTSATLTNVVGSGFAFGYYDSSRYFHSYQSTSATSVTVSVGSGSNQIIVKDSYGNTLYTHDSASALAIAPLCDGKAKTKLSNNGYTFYGGFDFLRYGGGDLTIVGVMNIEDYVKGVIPYEMSSSWPVEALKAQAVAARNYIAANFNSYATYGFDILNTAASQVYRGTSGANATTDKAVDETAGQYLTYNGSLCACYYFSCDGGSTESTENVWASALGYCRGKVDPYEAAAYSDMPSKIVSWEKSFTTAQISSQLYDKYKLGTISSIQTTMSPSGNCIKLVMTDVYGNTRTLQKSSVTNFLSALGFAYTSLHYNVTYNSATDTYTISGGGWGHNIGLSQWGAYSMAKYYSKTYQEILGFYYTDVCLSTGVYS